MVWKNFFLQHISSEPLLLQKEKWWWNVGSLNFTFPYLPSRSLLPCNLIILHSQTAIWQRSMEESLRYRWLLCQRYHTLKTKTWGLMIHLLLRMKALRKYCSLFSATGNEYRIGSSNNCFISRYATPLITLWYLFLVATNLLPTSRLQMRCSR